MKPLGGLLGQIEAAKTTKSQAREAVVEFGDSDEIAAAESGHMIISMLICLLISDFKILNWTLHEHCGL